MHIKFYAEYYDGMQAPFIVCKWSNDFEKLEELLKNTSTMLYKNYKIKLEVNYIPESIVPFTVTVTEKE